MAKREQERGLLDEVIGIYFHTKVTKGGRNLTCAALVAVGDGNGRAGLGYGKARAVPMAIEKATKEARGSMIQLNMVGDTVAHEIVGRHGTSKVLLRPARPGTGVKAGGTVRAIMRVAGVQNVVSKIHGSTTPINVAKATMDGLVRMRSVEEVQKLRGMDVEFFHPQRTARAVQPEEATQAVAAEQGE